MGNLKFKPFKTKKIIVERKDYDNGTAFERSITISLDGVGKMDITTLSEMVGIEPKSWGCGWGSTFSPEEFLALKELIKNIKVVDTTIVKNTSPAITTTGT